jgi:serine/threonine protein kinase
MDKDDGDAELVGLGRVGRVMRFGNVAVKTANIWTVPEDAPETAVICTGQMNETNMESLRHEGRVYRHLGHVEGVIEPYHISDTEIRMPFLLQGTLSSYLRSQSCSVGNMEQLRWLRDAAHIVNRVHERRVLIADIATRNFLLNPDLSLQMCDFTESVIVPVDENIRSFVSEDFVSMKFDIARFGSMMYEITSGSRYEFYVIPEIASDIEDDTESKTFKTWPTAEKLPNTENVFLGDIIRNCWLESGFRDMQDVCHLLDDLCQKQTILETFKGMEMVGWNWRGRLGLASSVAVSIIFAVVIVPRIPWRTISTTLPRFRPRLGK